MVPQRAASATLRRDTLLVEVVGVQAIEGRPAVQGSKGGRRDDSAFALLLGLDAPQKGPTEFGRILCRQGRPSATQ